MNLLGQMLTFTLLASGATASSGGTAPAWTNHAPPFSFQFGNEIDMHQQTRRTADGALFGFLYIAFTGTVTKDGERIATHVDCSATRNCLIGWTINGVPTGAELLYQEMQDHPVVLIERADIPQPGAFSHWHWNGPMPAAGTSSDGYLLQLVATERFCFIHHDAGAAAAGKTCRENGGIRVRPGLDTASHLNIVTSFPATMAP